MTKLTNSTISKARLSILCFILLGFCAVSFSGCARKPFGQSVAEDLRPSLESIYHQFSASAAACPASFDGDILIEWQQTMNTISLSGFFQTMVPSSFRITVLNPLGQPLFAAASDGTYFQTIDTSKRIFTTGRLRSYALLHDIPDVFVSGKWGMWLAGRPQNDAADITEMYTDPEGRGIWFSVSYTTHDKDAREYILLDIDEKRIVQRIILGKQGTQEATIDYKKWLVMDGCPQPQEISIDGLSFGAKLQLKLSAVQKTSLAAEDFKLPVPKNYLRKMLP